MGEEVWEISKIYDRFLLILELYHVYWTFYANAKA